MSNENLGGTGALSASSRPLLAGNVAFGGTGSLSSATTQIMAEVPNFSGSGRFCADAFIRYGAIGATSNVAVAGPGPMNNVVA